MRNKIAIFLVSCLALLLLGSGKVWGQGTVSNWPTYWANGCDCDGGTNNVNISLHDGLNIGGTRYSYWYTNINPTYPGTRPSRPTDNAGSGGPGYTPSPVLYWDGVILRRITYSGWTRGVCVNNDPILGCLSYTWTANEATDEVVKYPTTVPISGYASCYSDTVKYGDGHYTANPSHSHGVLRVNVNATNDCGAVHYNWFNWTDAFWGHYNISYNVQNDTWGAWSGSPSALPAATNYGIFTLISDVNIRIEGYPQFNSVDLSSGTPSQSNIANREVVVGNNYEIRFDQPFAGTTTTVGALTSGATLVSGGQTQHFALPIGSRQSGYVQTIGLWEGTERALSFRGDGTLLLGPNPQNQDLISLIAEDDSLVKVKNYVCCGGSTLHPDNDPSQDPLWENHGIHFKVGSVTNEGTINIYNLDQYPDDPCMDCNDKDTSTIGVSPWIKMDLDATQMDNLWAGIVDIRAGGMVKFMNPYAIADAATSHTITSWSPIFWPNDYSVADDATTTEYYHAIGRCCESYILAEGTQKYTFKDDQSSLTMETEKGKIQMESTFDFIGTGSNNKLDLFGIGGINIFDAVYIFTTNTGHANFFSDSSAIRLGSSLEYVQDGTTGNYGLTIDANGKCDTLICDITGGFVWIDGSISLLNVDQGYARIRSYKDMVTLNSGIAHTGVDGNLLIDGFRSVNINGRHDGTNPARPFGITLGAANAGNEGVYILRTGIGNDLIHSDSGHVYVASPFTYEQTASNTSGSGLTVLAEAYCFALPCFNTLSAPVGGYVQLDSAVTTINHTDGYSRIVSTKHFAELNQGYFHQGVDNNMTVKGYSYVDINGQYTTNSPFSGAYTLPESAGIIEGLYIERNGIGKDSIWSDFGSVIVDYPLTYIQNSNSSNNTNGFDILAEGDCDTIDCDLATSALFRRGGYVWLKSDVNTTNDEIGTTTINSVNHYIRIGLDTINPSADDWRLGRFTHTGVSGDLNIFAQGDCFTGCANDATYSLENHLWKVHDPIEEHHIHRGYVWIGNDVTISMDGTSGNGNDGNATIRSENDVVQMADSVTFSDTNGANFLVSGDWGVRTYGPTFVTNNTYNPNGNPTVPRGGTFTPPYDTGTEQGFVTYLSQQGYVDFGYGPDQRSDVDNQYNTPFTYIGDSTQNALLIEGYRRVFFGDSVTIKMDVQQTPNITDPPGNAKIYSPEGWISHKDTVEFTGFNGNYITYANGPHVSRRSCWVPYDVCHDYGGFVLYDSIFKINYDGYGVTWIRSTYDDVVFGDTVTYQNPGYVTDFGEIVIQAGQDIYGRNHDQGFIDAITIDQKGDKSILFEAKNTIHLEQNLFVTREGAYTGDITLKAGYPTFSSRTAPANSVLGETVTSQSANAKELPPSAELDYLTWTVKGNCPFSYNYLDRFPCDMFDERPAPTPPDWGSTEGGDIWLEALTIFDLTTAASTGNDIQTTLRAHKSIFIDSTLFYQTNVEDGGDVLMFAETGNVEAAVTRQNKAEFRNSGYIADDSVVFDIGNDNFNAEIRIQAGNLVSPEGGINDQPIGFPRCWSTGCADSAEFNGNILFNKPLMMNNKGFGYTIFSAARDIETQVMAPFIFNYNGLNRNQGQPLDITAGRHIETHALMRFDFFDYQDAANITMQAGRLNLNLLPTDELCKATEAGTSLTDPSNDLVAFDPDVQTGGVGGAKNNAFAVRGKGNGSILLFDSLEFNYNGAGKIYLVALNGNIESDPYLHRHQNLPANPGMGGLTGNWGDGYFPHINWTTTAPLQHDAQITFNHGGSGVTELKAIDIKLHDKIAYYANTPANDLNGRFYMSAFDSILTRNIEYVNQTDTGSVFITTAKYKATSSACAIDYCTQTDSCGLDNLPIYQGHIVLGYGADLNSADDAQNMNDSIVFNFSGNPNTQGANVYILAGYEGYEKNVVKGKAKTNLFTTPEDKGKGYGGNITFDFMKIDMAVGNHTVGGYLEISTPNGNIWGKDSIVYHGFDGDIKVDAGDGSKEDYDAIRWDFADVGCAGGTENTLNTNVPDICSFPGEWRTGNIMMKGAFLDYQNGSGNATFRTREGFIDMYDAFTVEGMRGQLLMYAGTNNATSATNYWGDLSLRDFQFTPVANSGSVFFGADDNIMLNYGYNNDTHTVTDGYHYYGRGLYDITTKNAAFTALSEAPNPYYWTTYKPDLFANRAVFNVNEDGYLWYQNLTSNQWTRKLHRLYRGCADLSHGNLACSGFTGLCETVDNYARPLMFNFDTDDNNNPIASGGLAVVATNYIDMFTKFTFFGGNGSGLASVPGMTSLRGEHVAGYGLYMKSIYDGQKVEKRRLTCEDCGKKNDGYQIGGGKSDFDLSTYEWTYIGFHDDARIHTNKQRSLLEAPIVEFFGHAELDAFSDRGANTKLTVKSDSLIFHDSAVFSGFQVELLPYTTDKDLRDNDMRYGVINDRGESLKYYFDYGPAITMNDRNMPVIEFGYQRCNEPLNSPHFAPNLRSDAKLEYTPAVGGDIIVAFKHDFTMPILNTVVANHARISFLDDLVDGVGGGEFIDACVRTDLLRIRNKVEFYTDPIQTTRRGTFRMTSNEQMPSAYEAGIFPHHLHMEPGSELSIPGEDSLLVISTTTVGGYGEIHENINVLANGIVAPGYASLMEYDCQTGYPQGKLSIHNLYMEKDAQIRISIGTHPENCRWNPDTNMKDLYCTQTDTLYVQDSIFFFGRIELWIMPETPYIEPGCYLFLEYNDLNASAEYVNNLVLMNPRHGDGDLFFALDKSEPGRVYLCVTTTPTPIIQRYVHIHAVNGVTTNPVAEIYHYVPGHDDFVFTATYSNKIALEVLATGYYTQKTTKLPSTYLFDGTHQYTIRQVVEPHDVYFGDVDDQAGYVGNEGLLRQRVWAYRNTLFINAEKEDVVSIYNVTGVLYRKLEIPTGLKKLTLERGVYIVTLKDGSVHKITIN